MLLFNNRFLGFTLTARQKSEHPFVVLGLNHKLGEPFSTPERISLRSGWRGWHVDRSAEDRRPYALVVDDEPLIRMMAVDILEDAGFRTFEADSTKGSLEILQRHHASITLMFTDVDLIDSPNGFVLVQETSRHWPHIGILVASGRYKPGPDDLPEGAYFVAKPFSAQVVHDRVKQVLPNDRRPDPLKE